MRLDQYLAKSGLCESRQKGRDLVVLGNVLVNGRVVTKPSFSVHQDDKVEIAGNLGYVSRAALKLSHALSHFALDVRGRVCIDVGASTGGFTEVLLENGARLVYAIDVGHDQLHTKLRQDPRVISIEGLNFRDVDKAIFTYEPNFLSMDVSFISASSLLNKVPLVLNEPWDAVVLVKPQFELGRPTKRGVVKRFEDHVHVLATFVDKCRELGIKIAGMAFSPILGREGNVEYLTHISSSKEWFSVDVEQVVAYAFEELLS